jgi:hypothetical protein
MEILNVPDMLSNCPNNADHCCPTFISFLAKQSVPFPVLTIGFHCCLAMGVIVSQQFVPLSYSNGHSEFPKIEAFYIHNMLFV